MTSANMLTENILKRELNLLELNKPSEYEIVRKYIEQRLKELQ